MLCYMILNEIMTDSLIPTLLIQIWLPDYLITLQAFHPFCKLTFIKDNLHLKVTFIKVNLH